MNALAASNEQSESKSAELVKKINQHIEELTHATDAARLSEEMTRYLDTIAKFHRYSASNVFSILLHKPNATHIAGYEKWKTMNRYVLQGEKGIPILAPLLVRPDKDDPDSPLKLCGFKVVYVFDISQTEGEPLPPEPCWKSPEKNPELQERLIKFVYSKGISVEFHELPGETQGTSHGGWIEISPHAGTKTLVHEIAHELMHHTENSVHDPIIRELEAEAVAFVVCKYFGINGLKSPNYIILHGVNSEKMLNQLENVRKIALMIVEAVDNSN